VRTDPVFGLPYPLSCPGVPSELLDPSSSWADKADFHQTQARCLSPLLPLPLLTPL